MLSSQVIRNLSLQITPLFAHLLSFSFSFQPTLSLPLEFCSSRPSRALLLAVAERERDCCFVETFVIKASPPLAVVTGNHASTRTASVVDPPTRTRTVQGA